VLLIAVYFADPVGISAGTHGSVRHVAHRNNFERSTSESGQKQTSRQVGGMSTLPPKADMARCHNTSL
jgi:hypothetical protein